MPQTLVTFLLDKSGSMASIKSDTMAAFNAYLDGLKQDGEGIVFSLLQFDTNSVEKTCSNVPVANAPALNDANYVPNGGTPLIDAAYETIKAVERRVENEADAKVVICIQTDGEENSSTAHTWDELMALIKEKTAAGWQFNFMGCGIDAYEQGARMGIAASATMSYDRTSPEATLSAFVASAANTRMYAAGLASNTSYSAAQRSSAGDAFAHKAGSVVTPASAPSPKRHAPKRGIVDKISL